MCKEPEVVGDWNLAVSSGHDRVSALMSSWQLGASTGPEEEQTSQQFITEWEGVHDPTPLTEEL